MVASNIKTVRAIEDDDSSKRRQIVDGARKVFMNLGFDGASMGEIARAAGVSKGTLYVYFADKNQLFEAIVDHVSAQEQLKAAFNLDPSRDTTTTLREFGQTYIRLLCRPEGGSAIRTVMAIAERMPDVGQRYYEHVLQSTIKRLAAYLDVQVANNALKIDNTELAAAQFMMMCQATLFLPFLFQAAPAPSDERIVQVIESATQMFLAAYQVKQN
ncbi:MAG: TetR family transcriptional regulator [Rhizobiales bacterium 62-47]|nr:TetR/AcrR family transcriptional regulator [Hyphomicrobiales bacterium]OJY12051.1 MAG: TetR family transcriptional regulator [Rhizobiales bacterium 62-47]